MRVPALSVRKFTGLGDIIKLNWLPVKENVEFNILKLAHKSLYDTNSIPEYLKLTLHQVTAYNLRSPTAPVFSILRESGTFQHLAATLFNRLRIAIRNILDSRRSQSPSFDLSAAIDVRCLLSSESFFFTLMSK